MSTTHSRYADNRQYQPRESNRSVAEQEMLRRRIESLALEIAAEATAAYRAGGNKPSQHDNHQRDKAREIA